MRYLLIIISVLSCLSVKADNKGGFVSGTITDSKGHSPVSFANVYVKELETGIMADVNGRFKLSLPKTKGITLIVSALNYVQKEIILNGSDKNLSVELDEQSYALKEVEVMANYSKQYGAVAEINQQALENIQPINVADVMVLTPGGLYQNNSITDFNRLSLRQSGSDANTSLGMAIVQDGMPVDNDGARSQLIGYSTDDYSSRSGINQGVDLRSISTDHLQKIEIIKGISSAKLGNLSSGVMQTTSKIGETPLQARIKTDPLNKLVYAGKGFLLSPKAGFLHVGADYADSYADKRDPLSKYTRITGQVAYNNTVKLGVRTLYLFGKLSEAYTLNQAREDELTTIFGESYRNKYSKTDFLAKAHLYDVCKFINNIELVTSLSYTYDLIDRTKLVQISSPMPQQIAEVEGEAEGKFLPSKYYSTFQIENKPVNSRSQLNLESLFNIGKTDNRLIYGVDYKYTKNNGEGVIVDMERPPFPADSKYVRPRANYVIPALSVGAAYLEEQMLYSTSQFDLNLKAGVRGTQMFNLAREYTNLRKFMLEPRLNGAFSKNFKVSGSKTLKTMVRLGYGQENKLPTLDYMYPDKVYKDLIVLNAYISQDNAYNHLITDTRIYDVTNYKLRASRNNKLEAEFDLEYSGWMLALTGFHEFTDNGFESTTTYSPVQFYRYSDPINGTIVGKQPQKSDYYEELYQTYVDLDVVTNTAHVDKKGLEYRIKVPKITALSTEMEINGAYYCTSYSSVADYSYFPTYRDNNKPMPYVGYYNPQDVTRQRIFNTNCWFNTNFPKYRLLLTTFVQCVWLNEVKKINGSSYPYMYMDNTGSTYSVTQDIYNLISADDVTWRHYHLYKEQYDESEPVSVTVNVKATKEFNKHIKAAFFVNNLLNINPLYTNRYNQKSRNWTKAFFGAELTFSI